MELGAHIIFLLCLSCLFFSYVIYPILMRGLAHGKSTNNVTYDDEDQWPLVSVLISAYNEEDVIEEKIKSLVSQDYKGKFDIYIGSDCSGDETNSIVGRLSDTYDNIYFYPFESRRGKPAVINNLERIITEKSPRSKHHIYIITDANVILKSNVISALASHFKNEKIGLVDSNMIYTGLANNGISNSENTYLNKEVILKNHESKVWKKMVGPFGGCYAFRSSYFRKIPENFLVDDFYIAMNVFEQGGDAINTLEAECYEPVSHKLSQEFKRKKRISAGNYQNLFRFMSLLNPFTKLGFSIMSHKVLRWVGPFLILGIILATVFLAIKGILLYQLIFASLLMWFIGIPVIDFVLSKLDIHIQILRSISYFNLMNLALAFGFFKFIKGVKKGTWERTARVQE